MSQQKQLSGASFRGDQRGDTGTEWEVSATAVPCLEGNFGVPGLAHWAVMVWWPLLNPIGLATKMAFCVDHGAQRLAERITYEHRNSPSGSG